MRPAILTVDDSKALRLFVARTLGGFACATDEASNGFNGFYAIQRTRPDLILLDIVMPVMDGVEMLRRLKGTPEIADIPVIMLASPADRPRLPELLAMGAVAILMKPFNEAALLEAVGQVLKLEKSRT